MSIEGLLLDAGLPLDEHSYPKEVNMNIYTIANNLRNTIAGKEELLASYNPDNMTSWEHRAACIASREFLEINIAELKKILADVDKCCDNATAYSWSLNPDRSGGAFTDEEINRSGEWR